MRGDAHRLPQGLTSLDGNADASTTRRYVGDGTGRRARELDQRGELMAGVVEEFERLKSALELAGWL